MRASPLPAPAAGPVLAAAELALLLLDDAAAAGARVRFHVHRKMVLTTIFDFPPLRMPEHQSNRFIDMISLVQAGKNSGRSLARASKTLNAEESVQRDEVQ